MTVLQSIVLGLIQGLTEFLPISSSAHLALIPYLAGWSNIPADQRFVFDVLVQLGTLLAVIVYFWKDLYKIIGAVISGLLHKKPFATPEARLGWYIVLATIPALIAGLLFKKRVEEFFGDPKSIAILMIVTAGLLYAAERFGKRTLQLSQLDWKGALWMGAFQALAIFPGVSRSGATISGGMLRSYDRPSAARFSFLMSIPIMLAASAAAASNLAAVNNLSSFLPVLLVGFIIAAISGFLVIHWLLRFLAHRPLHVFIIYRVVFGLLAYLLLSLNLFG